MSKIKCMNQSLGIIYQEWINWKHVQVPNCPKNPLSKIEILEEIDLVCGYLSSGTTKDESDNKILRLFSNLVGSLNSFWENQEILIALSQLKRSVFANERAVTVNLLYIIRSLVERLVPKVTQKPQDKIQSFPLPRTEKLKLDEQSIKSPEEKRVTFLPQRKKNVRSIEKRKLVSPRVEKIVKPQETPQVIQKRDAENTEEQVLPLHQSTNDRLTALVDFIGGQRNGIMDKEKSEKLRDLLRDVITGDTELERLIQSFMRYMDNRTFVPLGYLLHMKSLLASYS